VNEMWGLKDVANAMLDLVTGEGYREGRLEVDPIHKRLTIKGPGLKRANLRISNKVLY